VFGRERRDTETQEDPFAPSKSFLLYFKDPAAFADAIPGGNHGVLPVEAGGFHARAHAVNLPDYVAVRGIASSAALAFRSEFVGSSQSITYMFPVGGKPRALFDGKELHEASLVSRTAGDSPHLRTYGPHELGVVVMRHDSVRRAAAAFTGRDHANLLLTPGSLQNADPQRLQWLKAKYFEASRLLEEQSPVDLAGAGLPGVRLMRDEVAAALVCAMTSGLVKSDHLARQLQTASMARIERFIDDHRERLGGLQELCEETGLALRTVEAIVRARTDMPAHTYLARRRLAFVRKALLNPDDSTTVTRAAMNYGFLHLGRFSGFYRQVYGESPSATLRKVFGEQRYA
jgi:AraC-like DNA-binding protein